MKWLFLLLILPILEIIIFFKVNTLIGTFYTVSTIISTAVIGTTLVKKQGKDVLTSIKKNYTNPILSVSNGLLIIIAAILLLTPGFITDIIGFTILIPAIRLKVIKYLSKRFIQN